MKRILLLAICCFATHFCLAQNNPNPNSAIDAFIQDEMDIERLPGVASLVVKNGEIVWVQSYGFADIANNIPVRDTTVFMLASMSKLFTGTASMQLAESGTINIDRDINHYLPFTVDIPGFTADSVTVRQLMTHTSSIQDNYDALDTYYGYPNPNISLADCMQRYFATDGVDYDPAANFHHKVPGSFYDYSNIATALNGYVTEMAAGVPFDAFCETHIFNPLCMEKTSWNFNDFDSTHLARPYRYAGGNYIAYPHYGFADYPDGQLRSTVIDLAHFMLAYLQGGTFGESSILSANTIASMWTPQCPDIEPTQGLNWYQEEIFYDNGSAMLWGHNGGEMGVSTDMYLDPANDIGIVVLTNGEGDALYIIDELYNYALSLTPASGIVPQCSYSVYSPAVLPTVATEEIRIFPNPAKGQVRVNLHKMDSVTNYHLVVNNMLGETVLQTNITQPVFDVDLGSLTDSGVYLVHVIDSAGYIKATEKLIIGR